MTLVLTANAIQNGGDPPPQPFLLFFEFVMGCAVNRQKLNRSLMSFTLFLISIVCLVFKLVDMASACAVTRSKLTSKTADVNEHKYIRLLKRTC